MRRILAIGRRPAGAAMNDFIMDEVEERVGRLGDLIVARCDTPADLVTLVAQHGGGRGKVEMLDIFDHGGPGVQVLGSRKLFSSDGNVCSALGGADIAAALRPHLSRVAQVRLLGCLTATAPDDAGRWLLYKLANALGEHRVVFGTIDKVDVKHFSPAGFDPSQRETLLYSSLAALDGHAPSPDLRSAHIREVSTVLCP